VSADVREAVPEGSAAKLRAISAPTLVIWEEGDSYLGSDLAEPDRDDVPKLDRVERLADASHWVHQDEAERVNQLLIDFFAPDMVERTCMDRLLPRCADTVKAKELGAHPPRPSCVRKDPTHSSPAARVNAPMACASRSSSTPRRRPAASSSGGNIDRMFSRGARRGGAGARSVAQSA
jgi:hypothetical protein